MNKRTEEKGDLISRAYLRSLAYTIEDKYCDEKKVVDLYDIDHAITVNPFNPLSEETLIKITDAEWEHHDSCWITTPSGKKIELEKKRPTGEWEDKDGIAKCPFCKHNFTYFGNFCGNCGADMRKEAEDDN